MKESRRKIRDCPVGWAEGKQSKPLITDFWVFFFKQVWGLNLWLNAYQAGTLLLSCTFSPVCSAYFGNCVSFFAQASLDHDLPILCFPLLLG
jgi:hypothetical protein